MALTNDQERKVYEYLRVLQVSATGSLLSGVPVLTASTHMLRVAIDDLTPNGEASVTGILTTMDAIRAGMGGASSALGLKRVKGKTSEIEYQDGEGGFASRSTQWEYWRNELACVLGLQLWMLDSASGGGAREP